MISLRGTALEYARRGWPVFPLRVRGKAPLTPNGHLNATTDLDQVAAWWREHPEANIGFVPGRAGVLVLDVDGPEGADEATLLGLLAEPTMVVMTGRGRHLYFRHPGGTIGNRKLAPGIDVRADNGYVVLPPSVHLNGNVYRAVGRMDEIRDLPGAVVKALQASEPAPKPKVPEGPPVDAGTPRRRAYVVAAIQAECMELANTGEGNRNNRLNEAAFSLARFVATGEADPAKLADLLTIAARHAGLPDHEIQKTIRSAFTAREVAV